VDSPTEPVQFILSGAICDAVAVVLIVAVAVGLIVYFKKRPKLSSRGFFFK
jgi:hypothetical protein